MRLPQMCRNVLQAACVSILSLVGTFTAASENAEHSIANLIQFEPVAKEKNLSTIRDIAEDKFGFIWVAAGEDGTLRYDGYEFQKFNQQSSNQNHFADQIARKVHVDADGNLWIAGSSGIYLFDYLTSTFTEVLSGSAEEIDSGTKQTVYALVDNKLYFKTRSKSDFQLLPLPSIQKDAIASFHVSDHLIWLTTSAGGTYVFNEQTNTLQSLNDAYPNAPQMGKVTVTAVVNGEYWVGTQKGLHIFTDQAYVTSLDAAEEDQVPSNHITALEVRGNKEVWIGTDGGLAIFYSDVALFQSFHEPIYQQYGLNASYVWKILEDSNGNVYTSFFAKGLHKTNYSKTTLSKYAQSNSGNSIPPSLIWGIENFSGNYLLGTQNNGLIIFDESDGVTSTFPVSDLSNIWDIKVDSENKIWVAGDETLHAYRIENNQLIKLPNVNYTLTSPYARLFNDKIWISNESGITTVDTLSLRTDEYDLPEGAPDDLIIIFVGEDNVLWASTSKGLARLNLETSDVSFLKLGDDDIAITTAVEYQGTVYFGTLRHGLLEYDKQNQKLRPFYPVNNKIGNAPINNLALVEHTLWLTTGKHLLRTNLDSRTVVEFNSREWGSDIIEGSLHAANSFEVLLGLGDGLAIVHDSASELKPLTPPQITGLQIYNNPLSFEELKAHTEASLLTTEVITLNNEDSPFSIEFAVVNPSSPRTIQYRYQMLGLSDKWIETTSSNRFATFTNLGFGNYHLNIQARHPGGDWSESKSVQIHINAPLWLQPLALSGYSVVAMLLFIYWLRQYQVRRQAQIQLRESEERLKMSLWSSGDELWDWHIGDNKVVRSNTWGILDFPIDDQRNINKEQTNIHPNDLRRVQRALKSHLKKETEFFEVAYRVKNKRGQWMWLLDRGKVVLWNEMQPLRMAGTLKNITSLKQSEEQLRLFKRSIETISDGVFITDRRFQYISVNQAYCKITGETRARAMASNLNFDQYPDSFTKQIKQILQQKGNWFGEIESLRPNGEKFEIELNMDAIYGEDKQITHYVGVFSDITGRKRSEKELLKLANNDTLTSLPNRSFFMASLGNLVRKNADHVLICLDMDNFKKINDSMGHQVGDQLICKIAARLQKLAGADETIYRLGGDEFALLVENKTDMHRITHLAQRVLSEMAKPFSLNGQEFVLGCSVGIAVFPNDGRTPQELLKNADTAMYFAKNAGGNKYQFFSGEMNQNAVRQLQIETLIRHGLKENLFSVFYQPKVDVASGELVSMEALVRFEHPEKGIISPGQFIPLAEETGQIIDIGERVMLKACTDTQKWVSQGMFKGRVAINLSARQFELQDLDERIDAILKKTGLSPRYLELEITEGTLMQNPQAALKTMERLREMGIHLALDDFGTGYSSLAYLKKFPLNTLKIDKAFIDDIVTSEVDRHMTSAIITIAHNLGLTVVAEGVEDEKQLAILRRYQCEMIQGFLYSRPLNKERFGKLLSESHTMRKLINHNI